MKYRVKNTDLKHNDIIYPEGSIVELSEDEAKGLKGILEAIKVEDEKNEAKKKIKEARDENI